jgi:hypothetical protein
MGEDKAALTGTPAGTTGPTTTSAPQGTGSATVAKDPAPQSAGSAPLPAEFLRQIAEQIAAGTTVPAPTSALAGQPENVRQAAEFLRQIAEQIAAGTTVPAPPSAPQSAGPGPLSGDPGNAGKK